MWFILRTLKSGVTAKPFGDRLVVTVDRLEQQDDERDHHERDPGPARELGDGDDQEHDAGGDRADPVDHDVALVPLLLLLLVMAHHAELRQRERGEHADGVERDQRVGEAAERDDQQRGGAGEHEHAVREHQPVAPVGQLAGQIAVAGDDRRQPREVGVGGVRREGQDRRGRELEDHVQGPVAEHEQAHLGEHRLLVARVRRGAVGEQRHARRTARRG